MPVEVAEGVLGIEGAVPQLPRGLVLQGGPGVIPMTLMAVTAAYAVGEYSDGAASTSAEPTDSHTAAAGVLVRGLTRRQVAANGIAPSREKANTMRDAAAVSALPLKSWATITMSIRAFAPSAPRTSRKI
ncbi:hypothetical protein AQJ43_29640 [Streptomyces avermitilis]|uniref:Uncharacterized protein n=1 Tax=Streptomyces avermitilis TaxID=33903 RepID=A0A4D4N673_STRAX|nr:hypothetical protein AQJ43_29640 [Streptomyces avermitilis]GDY80068.1 hypothetical protein SAV31267_095530 [Streptomyces avermitilis]